MTYKAGAWLFEAMGQIPNEMILEAEQDTLHGELNEDENETRAEQETLDETELRKEDETDPDDRLPNDLKKTQKEQFETKDLEQQKLRLKKKQRKLRQDARKQKIGACLKYLPVAACLCIVFGFAAIVLQNVPILDNSASKGEEFDSRSDAVVEEKMEEAAQGHTDGATDDMKNETTANENGNSAGPPSGDSKEPALPTRYDAYEGPVLMLTATGDTQSLQTTRKLRGDVTAVSHEKSVQPIMDLTDSYQITNTAKEDKTVQLVYPFAASLNVGYGFEDTILEVSGEEALDVTYGIGDGVGTYLGARPTEPVKLSDYRLLLQQGTDYQEDALQKEANWDREVCVYFFTDLEVQKDSTGVVGVTVTGDDADVLTYGFDYATPIGEDGSANYCFFAPKEQSGMMLIVTGEQIGEPQLGYYKNLDCEEAAQGIECQVYKQYMSYSDALRLCSGSMTEQIERKYAEDTFAGNLPSYVNKDTVYQVLTVMSDERTFFDTLTERYHSSDLKEIYEILFAQTRIVYAMATVTIPAKESVHVTAHTQKHQMEGNYTLLTDQQAKNKDYRYDFLSFRNNRLNIDKTKFTLKLPDGWQLAAENIGMSQKKSTWEAQTQKEISYVTIAGRR